MKEERVIENSDVLEEIYEDEENQESAPRAKKSITLEQVTAILLSIMSILVSVVSVFIARDESSVAKKELEILTNDREAHFVVAADENQTTQVNDRGFVEYVFDYTVKNEGGRITGLRVTPYSNLMVYMYYYGPKVATKDDSTSDDEMIYYDVVYKINIKNVASTAGAEFDKSDYDAYDPETKEFNLKYRYASTILDMMSSLEQKLNANENIDAVCLRNDGVNIKYCNYQNEMKSAKYTITQDYITVGESLSSDDNPAKTIYFEFTDFGNEDAEKLFDLVKTRFVLDLKAYEENIGNTN